MFHGGHDNVPALGFQPPRRAEDGQIYAFGAAAGENDFTRLAVKHLPRAVPSIVQDSARLPPDVMYT